MGVSDGGVIKLLADFEKTSNLDYTMSNPQFHSNMPLALAPNTLHVQRGEFDCSLAILSYQLVGLYQIYQRQANPV